MSRIQDFDFNVDLLRAILWQYNDATSLQSLLQQKQDWYNLEQTQFWLDWYNNVFNLQTANEFGCSVWAIILNQPLTVTIPPSPSDKPTWGFGSFHKNFDNGNFANNTPVVTKLSLEQQRTVLQLRYFQLTSRGTVPEINRFLKKLFADEGLVYVLDGYDMTMEFIFTFVPSAALRFILESYDLWPRPAGVGVTFNVVTKKTWGFGEFHANFNNGNFQ